MCILCSVGVILAFFSNEQTYRSLDNLQESVNNVTGTGANFISNTLTVSFDLYGVENAWSECTCIIIILL